MSADKRTAQEHMTMLMYILYSAIFLMVSGENPKPMPLPDLEDRHALLTSPKELSTYFVGHTNIVVHWDPPLVYIDIHDIALVGEEGELTRWLQSVQSMTVHAFEKVFQSIPGSYVSKHSGTNETSAENGTNSTDGSETPETSTSVSTDQADQDSKTSTVWPVPPKPKCQPLSYFANYTVDLKPVKNGTASYKTVPYKETEGSHQRKKVTVDQDHLMVPFEEGCLHYYQITWEDTEYQEGGAMNVSASTTLFNLTGLKPGRAYEINVIAYYVSGHPMKTQRPIHVTTKQGNDSDVCACEWLGSKTKKSCSIYPTNSTTDCDCKAGYSGMFCEQCILGFYRLTLEMPCHACPCPPFSVKEPGCGIVEGFIQCGECHPAYTGNTCHKCADGYRMKANRCIPCFCNGNTPPGDRRLCDPNTGNCFDCQHNTTGSQCGTCLPGYVGDPFTYKNCTQSSQAALQAVKGGSGLSPGAVGAFAVVAIILAGLGLVGVIWYKRYRERKARHQFWTVEMKRDQDDVDFNTVHNEDAHMEDVDDLNFYDNRSARPNVNKYARLNEEL